MPTHYALERDVATNAVTRAIDCVDARNAAYVKAVRSGDAFAIQSACFAAYRRDLFQRRLVAALALAVVALVTTTVASAIKSTAAKPPAISITEVRP
jgi:hypothetical protein